MRKSHLFLTLILTFAGANAQGAEKRCGWYSNPTPANEFLQDKDGEWTISMQGGVQLGEDDPRPRFSDKQWVHTNAGSYGYGCACLDVVTKQSKSEKLITKITAVKALPLARCTQDKTLPKQCAKVSTIDSPDEDGKKWLVCED